MKNTITLLSILLTSTISQALPVRTYTHVTDPKYQPQNCHRVLGCWNGVPCEKYNLAISPPACYVKNYADIFDRPQLQAANEAEIRKFQLKLADLTAHVGIYHRELDKNLQSLVTELVADPDFSDVLAKKIRADLQIEESK